MDINSSWTTPNGLLGPNGPESVSKLISALRIINSFNAKYTLPVVVLSGIVGNLLALAVFIFSPLRRLTISVYLGALSLTDIIFLIFLGLGWLESMQINIFRLDGLCQTMVYVTFVVSFLSLWFIVIFTAELYLSIFWTSVHRLISRPKRAMGIALTVTILACIIYTFSFWLTRNVKQSETRITCGFNGNKLAAVAVPIMDSVLTLIVPFSLLIFMNVHIVYTVSSISNRQQFKSVNQEMRQDSAETTRANNVLAKVIYMGKRIRRSLNSSPRPTKSKISNFDTRTTNTSTLLRLENHERAKEISFSLSDGKITINNTETEVLSIAEIVVRKESLGITISRRASMDCPLIGGNKGIRISCSENSFAIKAKPVRRHTVSEARRTESRDQMPEMKDDLPRESRADPDIQIVDKKVVYDNTIDKSRGNAHRMKGILTFDEIEEDAREVLLKDSNVLRCGVKKHEDSLPDKDAQNRLISVTKLKRRCLKMIITVAVVFLVLNLPSHVIRLQSMVRSLFDPSYTTKELELHVQQLFQTIYYFNFIANVIIYSACAKSFRVALLHLPWHVISTFSQLFHSTCVNKEPVSYWTRQRQIREINEHSRLVEICIPELHLSQMPSFGPDYKYVSPPCLLLLEPSRDERQNTENSS